MSRNSITWLFLLVLASTVVGWVETHRHSNAESLVARVVEAVQNNDMKPVEDDFNAAARASMTHARIGRFADMLAPMGKLMSVQAMTPKDGDLRMYVVHFEHGDWQATMPVDAQGKVTGFAMRRMNS